MRIGIDFDGVLADVVQAKIVFARERFGVTLEPHETWRADAIERIGFERYNGMLRDLFGTARTLDIAPIAGALEVSGRLAEQHELIVLTARTDEERGPAEAWIRQHEVPISRFIHTSREPKPPVCAALGIDVAIYAPCANVPAEGDWLSAMRAGAAALEKMGDLLGPP